MTNKQIQEAIRTELEVVAEFSAAHEVRRRTNFLADYLVASGCKGYVLGISGGVDSTVGGRLGQLACEQVRAAGGDATFIAMRLPYHTQRDETDAQLALDFIRAHEEIDVNVGPASDTIWKEISTSGAAPNPRLLTDFALGNVKARMRMIAQFAVAGVRNMLVIGTDHAAEAVVGFNTKFGDGAADVTPLFGLSKRRVKALGRHLGAPEALVQKVPTADLETDKPMHPDEVALGVSYEDVDDYLEGKDIPAEAERAILRWYRRTAHKRALPVTTWGFEQAQLADQLLPF